MTWEVVLRALALTGREGITSMERPRIFISYCREDRPFVNRLLNKLAKLPVQPWQDVQELVAGQDWRSDIDKALRNCSMLLLVLSKVSQQSPYVNYEWAFAMGAGARIVPIFRESVPLHPRLDGIQYVDFTQPGKRWLRLLDALKRSLHGHGPCIRAAFEIEDAKPRRIGREFVISLSVDRLPPRSRRARYEVHDESFKTPIWYERNPEENFDTWMSSYGDVPISVRIRRGSIKKPEKEVRLYATLFDALRSTHANSRNSHVRKALKYIEEH